ncbi:pentapeptide repeat-containing protein [Pelistega sp. MC2]|uniref:pentapeptide repeat-containing protein n=1 Tax=Pelistega sp. MC2 TaxID=1720297 RepID=UPI0008D9537A|nr:pentapeptide repeat-containing protein [Pelistega sp. MC2]
MIIWSNHGEAVPVYESQTATTEREAVQEMLNQGIFLYNAYVAHADLSGMDFNNQDLSGTCFHDCKLKDAKFNNTLLNHTEFSKCDLTNANFINALLGDTTFSQNNMHQAQFNEYALKLIPKNSTDFVFKLSDLDPSMDYEEPDLTL